MAIFRSTKRHKKRNRAGEITGFGPPCRAILHDTINGIDMDRRCPRAGLPRPRNGTCDQRRNRAEETARSGHGGETHERHRPGGN